MVYRLAYGRRINRPGWEMLNPVSMGRDDTGEIIGNPELQPEVSDQIELGLDLERPALAMQVTPFLRWTSDQIRQIKMATERGGAATTLHNVERSRAIGADASVRGRPTDKAVITLSGMVAHMETSDDTLGSSGVLASGRLTVDVTLAGNTVAQMYAHVRSAQALEQGRILPAFTSEVSVTQRIAGDRGRLTLRLSDPLRTDRERFRVASPSFTQESRRRTARPVMTLFASYTVGGKPREDTPVRSERPARLF
jgi:outer membrane receptor protein involved in Fe transport